MVVCSSSLHFYAAEGNVLLIFQVLGSVFRIETNADVGRDIEADADTGTDRDTAIAVGEMKSLMLSDSLS